MDNLWCLCTKKLSKKLFLYHQFEYLSYVYSDFARKYKKTKPLARVKKCCVPRWQVAPSTLTCEGSPGGNSLAVL